MCLCVISCLPQNINVYPSNFTEENVPDFFFLKTALLRYD